MPLGVHHRRRFTFHSREVHKTYKRPSSPGILRKRWAETSGKESSARDATKEKQKRKTACENGGALSRFDPVSVPLPACLSEKEINQKTQY